MIVFNCQKKVKKFCKNVERILFYHSVLVLKEDDLSILCCPMALPCRAGSNSQCSLHWVADSREHGLKEDCIP